MTGHLEQKLRSMLANAPAEQLLTFLINYDCADDKFAVALSKFFSAEDDSHMLSRMEKIITDEFDIACKVVYGAPLLVNFRQVYSEVDLNIDRGKKLLAF